MVWVDKSFDTQPIYPSVDVRRSGSSEEQIYVAPSMCDRHKDVRSPPQVGFDVGRAVPLVVVAFMSVTPDEKGLDQFFIPHNATICVLDLQGMARIVDDFAYSCHEVLTVWPHEEHRTASDWK